MAATITRGKYLPSGHRYATARTRTPTEEDRARNEAAIEDYNLGLEAGIGGIDALGTAVGAPIPGPFGIGTTPITAPTDTGRLSFMPGAALSAAKAGEGTPAASERLRLMKAEADVNQLRGGRFIAGETPDITTYVGEDLGPQFGAAPSFEEALKAYEGMVGRISGEFKTDPFVQRTMASVTGSLEDPDAIDEETAELLKSRAVDTILGTAKGTEQQIRENLAKRGISDSGVSVATHRQLGEQTGRDIAAAERDIDIERELARRESEIAAQQSAAALTGQIGRIGLGESQLDIGAQLSEAGLGLQLGGLELNAYTAKNVALGTAIGLGQRDMQQYLQGYDMWQRGELATRDMAIRCQGMVNTLQMNKQVLIDSGAVDEHMFNMSMDMYEKALDQQQSAEDQAGFLSIFSMIINLIAGIGIPMIM